MVLLHGGPGLWDEFDDLAPLIDDIADVHRHDQRGGGRSERRGPYDIDTAIADIEALRVRWGHQSWIVGGHSWGAALAIAYAVRHPERVVGLLHISGTGVIDDWHNEYHENAAARLTPEQRERHAALRAIVKGAPGEWNPQLDREYCGLAWLPDFVDRDGAPALIDRLYRYGGPNYEANRALGKDWARLLADPAFVAGVARIEAPVLVLHGSEDPRPAHLAERLAASLPNARLVIVPKAGHMPWIEQPKAVRQALRSFLAALPAARLAV